MTESVSAETLIGRVQQVGQLAQLVSDRLIGTNKLVGLDYISIFTRERDEFEELGVAAAALGTKVYEKRGGVYLVEDEDVVQAIPSSVIRISEPADTQLLGCADIVPANFRAARGILLAAGHEEKPKSLNGHDYTIIEVTNQDLGVSIYLPSERMTRIMGITE
jgi:hypothetical protein